MRSGSQKTCLIALPEEHFLEDREAKAFVDTCTVFCIPGFGFEVGDFCL